jgi:hypothetical protein
VDAGDAGVPIWCRLPEPMLNSVRIGERIRQVLCLLHRRVPTTLTLESLFLMLAVSGAPVPFRPFPIEVDVFGQVDVRDLGNGESAIPASTTLRDLYALWYGRQLSTTK